MNRSPKEQLNRVLLVPPTARDAQVTLSILEAAGASCCVCASILQLIEELGKGAGAILLTDDSLVASGISELLEVISGQPAWSDVPVIVLMRGGTDSDVIASVLESLQNVTLLDRPVAARVLVSAIEVAVRSRMRQYETRELIAREQAARIEAERAAHSRDEFLAVVSHELRTPLHSIFGWTQILKRKPPSHEILSEGLDVIERGARAQTRLIEDILDMSRINSGKIHLEFKEVWMRPIVEAAIETIQPEAQTKGLQIETALDSNTGPILGDAARLQQVVLNLLSNAVKFTPPAGRIEVITRQLNHQLEIIVNDTGLGIDPGFLPHVFDRFRQADSSSARHFGGLGLGLAIVKQLVELHGGKVSAFSAGKNQGASFRVDLPLLRTASEREPLALHEHTHGNLFWDLSGVTVLVVDDDHDAVDIMKIMFEESNASVLTAHSGVEGLRMLEFATPDILVSDIGMPGMDGFEFIRRVRCAGQNIPAIAVTAFARVEDSTRAIEAGFSSHVAKPVDPARLLSTIQSLVHTREHATG